MKTKIILSAIVLSMGISAHSFAQMTTNKVVQNLIASVAGKTGGKISKDELLKANEIEVKTLDNNEKLQVLSYSFARIGKGRSAANTMGEGNIITKEMKDVIQNLTRAGDKVYFEEIKVKGADDVVKLVSPISFIVE